MLLQDTTIDLSNPLAVAAAAEHRQTLAAQASGADDDDDGDDDDNDESTHGAGGGGDAKDGGAGESTHTGRNEAQPPDSLNTRGDAVEARVLEELIDGLDDDLPEVEEVNLHRNHLFNRDYAGSKIFSVSNLLIFFSSRNSFVFSSEMPMDDVFIFYSKHGALYFRFARASLLVTMTTTERTHCLD